VFFSSPLFLALVLPPPLFLALMDIFTHLNGDWWLIDCDDALLPTPSTSFFGLTNVLMLMCVVF
jgi:hypothetical protein